MSSPLEHLRVDCAIVGAGLAGVATARELAARGLTRVAIVEREPRPGTHASGRNAAMIRRLVPEDEIGELARRGADAIASLVSATSRGQIFERRGSLLLAGDEQGAELERQVAVARAAGVEVELCSPARAVEHAGLARACDFRIAASTPDDGTVDVELLLSTLLEQARRAGASLHCGERVRALERRDSRWILETERLRIESPRVVNAAGAWASELALAAGAAPLELRPFRRHVARAVPRGGFDPGWPFVWEVERDAYFRPHRGALMICGCDNLPDEPADVDSDDDAIGELLAKVRAVFPAIAAPRVVEHWAGQRTFASDHRFVVGPDPLADGFFWVAGLGGHGVTTCLAVGELAARSILAPEREVSSAFDPARTIFQPE